MQDWEIAEAAETGMKPIQQLAAELGLRDDELIPYGNKLAKVDYQKVLTRLHDAPSAKYIDVTAITPTPHPPTPIDSHRPRNWCIRLWSPW